MARFRIMDMENNGHYLNIPGTEWEQIEIDVKTKRQARHRYKVHTLLEPKDPTCHNYPETGEIIISTKTDPLYPRDLVFVGPPTPGMEPLDAEAREIMSKMSFGVNPMSEFALPSTGGFGHAPAPAPANDQLAQMLAQMQAQNAMLLGQMEAMQRRIDELADDKLDVDALPARPPEPAQTELRL